ncbi:MAG: hypothetical protein E6J47_06355 [Chloroflexi bacterium]|nr:MAG: hypothetical protein E6J47_06355 [Chloroflexota bacterium]
MFTFSATPWVVTPRRTRVEALRIDSEGRCGGDHGRFEAAHVPAQVEGVAEFDDRVCDQLPGSVEGDVPAAVDTMELGTYVAQALRGSEEVRLVAAAADGEDREVLDQQQPVADPSRASLLGQLVLELPGGEIGDRPEPIHAEQAAVGEKERALVAGRGEGLVPARPARRGSLGRGRRRADVSHAGRGHQTATEATPGTCSAAW